MLGLEFPPINELLRWQDIFPTFNKIALIAVAAALIGIGIFLLAGSKDGTKAPKGVRNLAETIVEFIENQVVMPTMGRAGLGWTPFLISLFLFIYLCNVPGIIEFSSASSTISKERNSQLTHLKGRENRKQRSPYSKRAHSMRRTHLHCASTGERLCGVTLRDFDFIISLQLVLISSFN